MKYSIKSLISLLITFGFIFSCAQAPQKFAEKKPALAKYSTVRLVSQGEKPITLGSGFFVDKDKIVTNIHVVAQSVDFFANFSNTEKTLSVEGVAAFDVKNNLVILKLSGEGSPLSIGDSNAVQKGESVSVIEYTDGKYKATTGTIDNILMSNDWFWMKVATPIEISGSPVLNDNGQVIGATVGYGDGSHSYVIPSNALKALLTKSNKSWESLTAWKKREHIRAEVQHSQGEQKYGAKKYKKAIADFDRAIELNAEHVRAYYKRGNTKHILENYVDAIEDYTDAIKINPQHARAYNNRGNSKIKLENYVDAIEDYTDAIKINPQHARAYNNRGSTKFILENYVDAIEDFTLAIKLNSEYANAYRNRGIVKCKMGDIESGQGDAEMAIQLYYEGFVDVGKSIQLRYRMDADAPVASIESKKGIMSTVCVINWSDGLRTGSGFFIGTDKIATNIHNIDNQGLVYVKLINNDSIWKVEEVSAFDVEHDLVVLKVSGEGRPLPLGDSDEVQKGIPVVTVGYPDGKYRVTTGNVHGIRNSDKWIGTTAETSKGNSGGPLLNGKGEVIGINTRLGTYSYAVPSNILKPLLAWTGPPEPLAQWQKRDQIRAIAYFGEGEDRYENEEYTKAIINFDDAILHNPKYIRAYNWRGRAKYRLGQSKAEQGNLAEAQKLYHAAIADFTQGIKIYPKFYYAFYNRGKAKRYLGESKAEQGNLAEAQHLYVAAINDFSHSIKIDPKYNIPFFQRGLTRTALGRSIANQGNITKVLPLYQAALYQAAIEDYTQAIQLFPKYAMAYNNRGWVKYLLGKSKVDQGDAAEAQQLYQTAIDDYTEAIKIDPQHVLAHYNRGNAKKALGQSNQAQKDFAKAKELESEE